MKFFAYIFFLLDWHMKADNNNQGSSAEQSELGIDKRQRVRSHIKFILV